MITVKLMGTPTCRRYQKMRTRVIEEAERLEIAIQVEEVGDMETFSRLQSPQPAQAVYKGHLGSVPKPAQGRNNHTGIERRYGEIEDLKHML